MKEYITKYGEWKEIPEMMNEYYYSSYLLDIDTLKLYLLEFYNAYVTRRPYTRMFNKLLSYGDAGSIGVTEKTKTRKIHRRPVSREEMDAAYGSRFWLKTYMFFRMYETGRVRENNEIRDRLKEVIQLQRIFDFDTALGYINDWLKEDLFANVGKMVSQEGNSEQTEIANAINKQLALY